jgi:Lon protease-like protein
MKVPGHTDFVVIALNGVHRVNVDFCGCLGRPDPYIQLLEMRWWPSTPIAPQTAAIMDLLRCFHVLNLQSRVPPTDFYRSLVRMVDGQGLRSLPVCFISDCTDNYSLKLLVKDRLAQFMVIIREWRHIKMLKRAGRGHDSSGISGTQQGELTIPCRACPQPGINLPLGWQKTPDKDMWVSEPDWG